MASFQPLLRTSRLKGTTQKPVSIQFSCSQNITTSVNLQIQKTSVLEKSIEPNSSLVITSVLIIDKARSMELQTFYLNILSKMPKKKLLSEPKTPRFYTGYNFVWPTFLFFSRYIFLSSSNLCLQYYCFTSIIRVLKLFLR